MSASRKRPFRHHNLHPEDAEEAIPRHRKASLISQNRPFGSAKRLIRQNGNALPITTTSRNTLTVSTLPHIVKIRTQIQKNRNQKTGRFSGRLRKPYFNISRPLSILQTTIHRPVAAVNATLSQISRKTFALTPNYIIFVRFIAHCSRRNVATHPGAARTNP